MLRYTQQLGTNFSTMITNKKTQLNFGNILADSNGNVKKIETSILNKAKSNFPLYSQNKDLKFTFGDLKNICKPLLHPNSGR